MRKLGLNQRTTVKVQTSIWIKTAVGLSIAAIVVAAGIFIFQTFGTSKESKAGISGASTINKALQLDGKTQYIDIGSVNFGFTNSLTVMAWVKWDTTPTLGTAYSNIATINKTTNSDQGQFWIQHNYNNTKFEFALQTTVSRSNIWSTTQPKIGNWYHLAAVYDGLKMRLFINGVEEASLNKTGNIANYISTMKLNIGQWAYINGSRRFKGSIDDVAIYNVAYTSSQIKSKMNPDNITSADVGLLGAWKFDDELSTTITDISPFARNAANPTKAPLVVSSVPQSEAMNLPIDLYTFDVKANGNNAMIEWVTASEINNDYFTIERALNGLEFEIITTKKGAGNSNSIKSYSFVDQNLNDEGVYFYRLTQTDFDGKKTIFEPKILKISIMGDIKVFPNPIKQGEIATLAGINGELMSIEVFNSEGKNEFKELPEQSSSIKINTSNFNKGTHFIKVSDGIHQKLVKLQVY